MNNSPTARTSQGITLIELLVALAIGSIIMTLVLASYRAFNRSEARQFERSTIQSNADGTIEFLRRDIQQLFQPPEDNACMIELENSATNLVRLAFCRWEPMLNRNGLMTNRLERVEFTLTGVGEKSGLMRLSSAMTGPASLQPATTNTSAHRWPRLQVQLFDGTAWQTNWPGDGKSRAMAARIILRRSEDREPYQEAMVLIPAGLSVTSRVPRSVVSPGI